MELVSWSYYWRNKVKALFDKYPNSPVTFRRVANYYFTHSVDWSAEDPIVSKSDLQQMELLLNRALGYETEYLNRKRWRRHSE